MSDRDLWHWDGFNAAEDWTAWDTKAVLAQGKELKKRAQAAGWGYDARKLEAPEEEHPASEEVPGQ